MIARKALLVAAFTVWSRSIAVKLELTVIVLVISSHLQRGYKPMLDTDVDKMESVTLLLNILVLVAGLGTWVSNESTESSALFLYAVFSFFLTCCVGTVIWLFVYLWRHKDELKDSSFCCNMDVLSGETDARHKGDDFML